MQKLLAAKRQLFSIFWNRGSSEAKKRKRKRESESDSRFLCTRTKRKQIAEYISIYIKIYIYVCMCIYVYTFHVCTYIHEPTHATRTRRASASLGATILPDWHAIERLLDNQNECLGSDPGCGRAQIWENFLPADRRARGLRAERRRQK